MTTNAAQSSLGWFIIPVPASGTGAGTFQKSGWKVVQAQSAAQQAAYIAAGYLGPYPTQAEAQAHFQAGHFQSVKQVQQQTNTQRNAPPLPNPLDSWLKSLGGEIGSGLEAAAVAFLKDLWDVILGPIEILAGVILGIVILMYAFKDDLMKLTPIFTAMA